MPTPSICVAASTMNIRLPLMPTAATAVSAQTSDPVEIDEDVKGLKHHAHQHEAGGLQQMPGERSGGEVLHSC